MDIFFQLDTQTRLAQAEANLVQFQVDYQVAVATVDHATGALLPAYQVRISELAP